MSDKSVNKGKPSWTAQLIKKTLGKWEGWEKNCSASDLGRFGFSSTFSMIPKVLVSLTPVEKAKPLELGHYKYCRSKEIESTLKRILK